MANFSVGDLVTIDGSGMATVKDCCKYCKKLRTHVESQRRIFIHADITAEESNEKIDDMSFNESNVDSGKGSSSMEKNNKEEKDFRISTGTTSSGYVRVESGTSNSKQYDEEKEDLLKYNVQTGMEDDRVFFEVDSARANAPDDSGNHLLTNSPTGVDARIPLANNNVFLEYVESTEVNAVRNQSHNAKHLDYISMPDGYRKASAQKGKLMMDYVPNNY